MYCLQKATVLLADVADSALRYGTCLSRNELGLQPERPFTGVSGRSGPEISKKPQKESFGAAKIIGGALVFQGFEAQLLRNSCAIVEHN